MSTTGIPPVTPATAPTSASASIAGASATLGTSSIGATPIPPAITPIGDERSIPKVSETRIDKAGSRRALSIIAAIALCLVGAAMFVGHKFSQWKTAMRAPASASASNNVTPPRQFEQVAPGGSTVTADGAAKGVLKPTNPADPRAFPSPGLSGGNPPIPGAAGTLSPDINMSPCPPGMNCQRYKSEDANGWKPPAANSSLNPNGAMALPTPIPFIPYPQPKSAAEQSANADMFKRYYPDGKMPDARSGNGTPNAYGNRDPYDPKSSAESHAAALTSAQAKAAAQIAEMEQKFQRALAAAQEASANATGTNPATGVATGGASNNASSPSGGSAVFGTNQAGQSSDVFAGGGLRTSVGSGSGLSASGGFASAFDNAQGGSQGGGNTNATGARSTSGFVGTLASSRNAASTAEVGLDLNTTALKGRSFECVLNSKLVSTLPGFFACHLTENLYSANGKVVLAERGSEVTGETDGTTRVGQSRIPLLASRLNTTKGVFVNLDSPGTDALGGSGIAGDVNNHWPQRIGAALLLAVVQDGFALAAADKGQVVTPTYQATQSSTQTLAGKVLDSTINTPPTITKYQGERIRIFLARDLDFSQVYEIRKTK
jgi:type IV secretory pathway VirB10-like protein